MDWGTSEGATLSTFNASSHKVNMLLFFFLIVQSLEKRGNGVVNQILEAEIPDSVKKPTADTPMEYAIPDPRIIQTIPSTMLKLFTSIKTGSS